MSRAERRQYQRLMKGQDPYAPPPRTGGRRPPRRPGSAKERDWSLTRGFWLKTVGVGVLVGVGAFSLIWSRGAELAFLVGLAATAATVGVIVVFRLLLRRAAAR